MVSVGSDGECVEVVGRDRTGGPGPRSSVAFEAGALEAVAALEVADAPLDADAEACEAAVGVSGASRLAAGDEDAVGAGQVFGDAEREEAAIECELSRAQLESLELGCRGREQVGLVGRADLAGDGDDQPTRAAAGVLADLVPIEARTPRVTRRRTGAKVSPSGNATSTFWAPLARATPSAAVRPRSSWAPSSRCCRLGLPAKVGALEQARVGRAHRALPGERTEVGGVLLAPVLADALRDRAEQHRADRHGRHRGDEPQHRLARSRAQPDRPPPAFCLPPPHAHALARRRSRLHTHASQNTPTRARKVSWAAPGGRPFSPGAGAATGRTVVARRVNSAVPPCRGRRGRLVGVGGSGRAPRLRGPFLVTAYGPAVE